MKLVNWQEHLKKRSISAVKAASKIKSGDRVVLGHACGEPRLVIEEMVAAKDNYRDVEIVHMVAMGKGEYTKPEMAGHFRHNAIFAGATTRDAINEGRGDFTPVFFFETPRLFQDGYLPVDVALVQVTPPDKNGWCSLGVSSDYTKPVIECAKMVIAEVNDKMPRTYGDNFVHISQIDWFVPCSYQIKELQPPKISDIEKAIGEHCAELVKDGDTLQLGIGAIPDAVLLFLKDKKNLGIHSEMFSDGVLELIEAGVVNCSKKTLHPGKLVVSFLMGTQRLYDFVDNNPMVAMYPVNYVNNPIVIAQNDNLVSINSTIEVDFMGQAASDTMGYKQFSGIGGQVDFVRGASLSRGGRSIIAMPSTAAKGTQSRIVPILKEGAAVSTSRNDIHYVVTEFGAALLRGASVRERARRLIGIAHPDFRPELIEAWEKRFNQKF